MFNSYKPIESTHNISIFISVRTVKDPAGQVLQTDNQVINHISKLWIKASSQNQTKFFGILWQLTQMLLYEDDLFGLWHT